MWLMKGLSRIKCMSAVFFKSAKNLTKISQEEQMNNITLLKFTVINKQEN